MNRPSGDHRRRWNERRGQGRRRRGTRGERRRRVARSPRSGDRSLVTADDDATPHALHTVGLLEAAFRTNHAGDPPWSSRNARLLHSISRAGRNSLESLVAERGRDRRTAGGHRQGAAASHSRAAVVLEDLQNLNPAAGVRPRRRSRRSFRTAAKAPRPGREFLLPPPRVRGGVSRGAPRAGQTLR